MISFYKWLENTEDLPSSLSEPEHKQGEGNLSLGNIIKKRINELVSELESKGKASKKEILFSIFDYINKQSQQNNFEDDKESPQTDNQMGGTEMGGPQVSGSMGMGGPQMSGSMGMSGPQMSGPQLISPQIGS